MQLRRACTREPETYESTQASREHRQASRVGSTGRSFRGLVSDDPGSSRAAPCEMFGTLTCTGSDADATVVPDLGGVASCRCRDQQVRSTESASDGDDGDRHAREAHGARPIFIGRRLHQLRHVRSVTCFALASRHPPHDGKRGRCDGRAARVAAWGLCPAVDRGSFAARLAGSRALQDVLRLRARGHGTNAYAVSTTAEAMLAAAS